MSELALLGGTPIFSAEEQKKNHDRPCFHWPIVNEAMEQAVLKVLRDGSMSQTGITEEFERGWAAWHGVKHALAHPNGTAALHSAMYAVGVGPGTEVICPSITYWASAAPALNLGARVVFADIEPDTLCLDPASFEAHITPRTRAVVVVHYLAHPADMDPILAVARKHGVAVIEDVSHAQGALYKGKMVGTFGDIAASSLMSGKSFAIGEGGILNTDSTELWAKAIRFGHYERLGKLPGEFRPAPEVGPLPWGGFKYRLNQMASAIGIEQLKKYPAEIAAIEMAMKYFVDAIGDIPALTNHYPKFPASTKGGWYAPHMHYAPEAFDGLSVKRFSDALRAECGEGMPGCNAALHRCELFYSVDIYGHGKPTVQVFDPSDPKAQTGELPVAAAANSRTIWIPQFRQFDRPSIDRYVEVFRKVAANYRELLPGDGRRDDNGRFSFTH